MIAAIRREPVLLGAAVTATVDGVALLAGVSQEAQTILHGIVIAWVALLVRSLSTPTVAADEAVAAVQDDAAKQVEVAKYVGAVEHQATAAAGRIVAATVRRTAREEGIPPA